MVKACQKVLSNEVQLTHRNNIKRFSVFTDSFNLFWLSIQTQVLLIHLYPPYCEQAHEQLPFLSGRFNKIQMGWYTLEKEECAIMVTVQSMHWLTATHEGYSLFIDQNNCLYLFDLLAVVVDLSQMSARKITRWAARFLSFNYVCFQISGNSNVWADFSANGRLKVKLHA